MRIPTTRWFYGEADVINMSDDEARRFSDQPLNSPQLNQLALDFKDLMNSRLNSSGITLTDDLIQELRPLE